MALTPIRRQYLNIKRQYPQAIVLFRLGDFYETFDEDAHTVSKELDLVLTSRPMGKTQRVPMAGVPAHALESYLARLIHKGYRVAICEQVSEPSASKGLVEREVVRVVTPGTVSEPALLIQQRNNYLAAAVAEGELAGVAYIDITTSEFGTTQLPRQQVLSDLERLAPAEVLVPPESSLGLADGPFSITPGREEWFDLEAARGRLLEQFQVATLDSFGCAGLPLAIRAAGAILSYLEETQKGALGQIIHLSTYSTSSYMTLDPQTRRNLELFQGSRWGGVENSLLSVLDHTKTPMGGRLLRRWFGQPALSLKELEARQEVVEWLQSSTVRRQRARTILSHMGDLERLTNRIRSHQALPREVVSLARSLAQVPALLEALQEGDGSSGMEGLLRDLEPCTEVVSLVQAAIVEDSPATLGRGGLIRPGFSPEMDQLEADTRKAKEYIASLERRERERTGIKSLKVGFNRVFGYYLEVSKSYLPQVPESYLRKQTLVGGERFFTPELKEYESLILNSKERLEELEREIFRRVCQQIGEHGEAILDTSAALGALDAYASLAEAASLYGYTRPALNEGGALEIKAGRHPVVERALPAGTFVPNDTCLSSDDAQIVILTGPNMSGKSTYLRQVALIVLMAQIGSFVPAASATIGLVDRIFTRVGLQDDLVTGQSTFMVEMVETANILHHATSRSLIILDEIGRGTSTYDGLAIAQAVAEHIHNYPGLRAKTLFATHYHELVDLANRFPRARNYSVAVSEEQGRVVFLHRILPGGADKSYGIHVAQLAGLPRPVIRRAQELLQELETNSHAVSRGRPMRTQALQLPLLATNSEVIEELTKLDVSSMTPLEAITKLFELQKRAKEDFRDRRDLGKKT